MSYVVGEEVDLASPFRYLVGWGGLWAGLLVGTKALDVVTTAVGLLVVPGFSEANPFAAAVFESVGVITGLLLLSIATIVVVGLVTETGARYLERLEDTPEWAPTFTRTVGYGPLSVVFGAAALHNTGLIVRVLLSG